MAKNKPRAQGSAWKLIELTAGRGSQAWVLYYYLHLDTVAANIGPRGRFLTLPRKLIVICH